MAIGLAMTRRQLTVPQYGKIGERRITADYAIRCALLACVEPTFAGWAEAWLSGENRTAAAAYETEVFLAKMWAKSREDEALRAAIWATTAAERADQAAKATLPEEIEWTTKAMKAAAVAAVKAARKVIPSGTATIQ